MTDDDDVHSSLVSKTFNMGSQVATCAFGFLAWPVRLNFPYTA